MRASRDTLPDAVQVLEVPPRFELGNGGFADGRPGTRTKNFRRAAHADTQRGATGSNAAGVTAASRPAGPVRVLQITLHSSEKATAEVRRVRAPTPDLAMAVLLRLLAPEAWR